MIKIAYKQPHRERPRNCGKRGYAANVATIHSGMDVQRPFFPRQQVIHWHATRLQIKIQRGMLSRWKKPCASTTSNDSLRGMQFNLNPWLGSGIAVSKSHLCCYSVSRFGKSSGLQSKRDCFLMCEDRVSG